MKAIVHARLISDCRISDESVLLLDKGKIAAVLNAVPDDFDGELLDAHGMYVSAGFMDLHTHGAGGYDFMDADPEEYVKACQTYAKFGTTSFLPTTLAGDEAELCASFRAFHEANKYNNDGAQMLGMHLEGPYFSKQYKGAQDEKYIVPPTAEQYRRIYDLSQGAIVRWSAAPELPGIDAFVAFLQEKGVLASVAHTSATYEDMLRAFLNGFKLITHLYSGMSSIERVGGFRVPGVVESAYLIDDIYAELIADGCHLPPALLQLAYKCKGKDHLVLVTDSMRGAGMPEGESVLGSRKNGQTVYIEKGVAFMPDRTCFAGSVCTADRLVRTMHLDAGIPLEACIQMITHNPAKLLGLSDRKGDLHVGADADLVLFDDQIHVQATVIAGKVVHGAF